MINWGFLGAGWIATKALAPAVHEAKSARLLGVASQDQSRATALAPEKIYDRYEDLLADPEIDAVYINLANHQHCQWTIAALAAGKHVLCEKPLSLNYAQGQLMADAATKSDRVLVEAVWNRWHPRFARIVELVNGGDIGALNRIESSFCFPAQIENNYRLEKEMGGGSLLDVGVYQAHLWRALIHGEPELNIESLTENIGSTGVDLTTQIVGKLGNSVEISALSSFEMPESQKLVISGELATIECPGNDAFTSWNKPSSLLIGDHLQEFAPVDPYRLMIENIGACILGESAWIPPVAQSLYVAKLLDQIKAFDN
jgi:xylose dehydrogenase (NAD/NADP)